MKTKKHVSQMTELEQEFLLRRFHKLGRGWRFTNYSHQRFVERRINPEVLMDLIKNHRLIEFHRQMGEDRILLRGRAKNGQELCGVFSLTSGEIITLWYNSVNNQHDRLVISEYEQTLDIVRSYGGTLCYR